MLIYTTIWAVLAVAVICFAAYRKLKARNEDDVVHVSGANWTAVDKQSNLAHSIETIDRWGVILTVVTVIYGLILGGVYLNGVFQAGQKNVW